MGQDAQFKPDHESRFMNFQPLKTNDSNLPEAERRGTWNAFDWADLVGDSALSRCGEPAEGYGVCPQRETDRIVTVRNPSHPAVTLFYKQRVSEFWARKAKAQRQARRLKAIREFVDRFAYTVAIGSVIVLIIALLRGLN